MPTRRVVEFCAHEGRTSPWREALLRDLRGRLGVGRVCTLVRGVEWSTDRSQVRLEGLGCWTAMQVDAHVVHVSADRPRHDFLYTMWRRKGHLNRAGISSHRQRGAADVSLPHIIAPKP